MLTIFASLMEHGTISVELIGTNGQPDTDQTLDDIPHEVMFSILHRILAGERRSVILTDSKAFYWRI